MVLMLVLIFIIIWIFSSIAFDRIIEYQHENYKEEWVKDGKPRGMFFNPVDGSALGFWALSFRQNIFSRRYISHWAEDDSKAIALYKKLKFWSEVTKYYIILFFPLLILSKCYFET